MTIAFSAWLERERDFVDKLMRARAAQRYESEGLDSLRANEQGNNSYLKFFEVQD
jgi:lipopolysaccharide export system protein LptC